MQYIFFIVILMTYFDQKISAEILKFNF